MLFEYINLNSTSISTQIYQFQACSSVFFKLEPPDLSEAGKTVLEHDLCDTVVDSEPLTFY